MTIWLACLILDYILKILSVKTNCKELASLAVISVPLCNGRKKCFCYFYFWIKSHDLCISLEKQIWIPELIQNEYRNPCRISFSGLCSRYLDTRVKIHFGNIVVSLSPHLLQISKSICYAGILSHPQE